MIIRTCKSSSCIFFTSKSTTPPLSSTKSVPNQSFEGGSQRRQQSGHQAAVPSGANAQQGSMQADVNGGQKAGGGGMWPAMVEAIGGWPGRRGHRRGWRPARATMVMRTGGGDGISDLNLSIGSIQSQVHVRIIKGSLVFF